MLARLLVLLVVLASLAPAVGAAVPLADPTTDIVMSHQAYDWTTFARCSSNDAFISVVSSDLTSRFTAAPAGPGLTLFTLHLDATLADPVNGVPACDAAELTFTSDIAWPLRSGYSGGSFSATCGLSGFLMGYGSSMQDSFMIYFDMAPSACALPIDQGYVAWSMTPVHPQTAAACSPLVVPACAGAYSWTYPSYGCGGGEASRFVVSAVIDLAYVERSCHFWSDQREHVVVTDGFGVVRIDTTSDSCTVFVSDPLGVTGPQSTPCPAEIGDAIYGTDWAHLLP